MEGRFALLEGWMRVTCFIACKRQTLSSSTLDWRHIMLFMQTRQSHIGMISCVNLLFSPNLRAGQTEHAWPYPYGPIGCCMGRHAATSLPLVQPWAAGIVAWAAGLHCAVRGGTVRPGENCSPRLKPRQHLAEPVGLLVLKIMESHLCQQDDGPDCRALPVSYERCHLSSQESHLSWSAPHPSEI